MIHRSPFPLDWPIGKPRTGVPVRSRFKTWSVAQALAQLRGELDRFEATSVVITTNVELRHDGLPYSGRREPDDRGVAVYFMRLDSEGHTRPFCIALDQYDRVADNLVALARVIEAYRSIARHGGGQLLEQATSGFAALPPAPPTKSEKLRAIAASTTHDGERRAMLEQAAVLEARGE